MGVTLEYNLRRAPGYRLKNKDRLLALTRKSLYALMLPYSVWLVIAIIFRSELVPLFYGEGYTGYDILFLLMAFKVSIDSITSPLNSALQTAELAGHTTFALVAGAALTLILG